MCEIAVLSLLLLSLFRVEALALGLKAVGTRHALVVHGGHRFVARVAWQLHRVVLNNILLHNCVAALSALEL